MGEEILEAATKKKRGRPRKYEYWEKHNGYREREGRSLQNYVQAETLVTLLWELAEETGDKSYRNLAWFFEDFSDEYGDTRDTNSFKCQGVAEQIGRMYNAGRIDAQEAVDLTRWAIHKIEDEGLPSRTVEKSLRQYHKSLRLSVAATENKEA